MNRHETVTLQHPEDGDIEIDKEIAPLVQWCWDNGMDTACSCAGDEFEGHSGYITFTSFPAAATFFNEIQMLITRLGKEQGDTTFAAALNTWWDEVQVGQVIISPSNQLERLAKELKQ